MNSLTLLRSLSVVTVAALAGCGEVIAPTPPALPEGVFVLQAYATHPLPTVIFESPGYRVTLLADTVQLGAGGAGSRIHWMRLEPGPGGVASSTVRVERHLVLVVQGSRLRANESVICALSHSVESCHELWDAPVVVSAETLRIGPREYSRVVTAP